MSQIRNIGRYKAQIHHALAAFVLMLASSVKEADLFIDVTPQALDQINKDASKKLDHVKLAICRPDGKGIPYQFNHPALTSAILKASAQTNAIAKKAKTKTPEILFSETGYLYVAGAKFDAKAPTIQEIKASKPAPAQAPAPTENDSENEDAGEDEGEPNTTKKGRKKKGETA